VSSTAISRPKKYCVGVDVLNTKEIMGAVTREHITEAFNRMDLRQIRARLIYQLLISDDDGKK